MAQKLKLISWNVNGLNLARKRRHIFHWLNKQNCNVICIQEAHIKRGEEKFLVNKYLGEKFHSLMVKKRRGNCYLCQKRT